MTSLIATYGLPLVALIIFAGELGIPTLIPGEIGLLLAGNQDIRSLPMLLAAIAVFGTIDLVATSTIHIAARTGGNRLLKTALRHVCHRKNSPEDVMREYRRRLGGRDSLVVFVTRLIPVFRLYASITTGLIKVDYKRFVAGAAPAAWVWAGIPLTAGYLLRSQLGSITSRYTQVMPILLCCSVAITGAIVFTMWMQGRKPVPVTNY